MNTPEDIRPDVLAKALEDRGYDSLFIGEHSHIPASRKTPYPTGTALPPQYLRMMDPFVSLAIAASATTNLRLGTGVALVLEHDVLDLAKTVATLDLLSGGRVLFGVGVGWNEEELANHRPIPWRQRFRGVEECVAALRRLWCDHDSEFHGKFYDFDKVWSFPKPLQTPHPPVVFGGSGRLGMEHTARWADEWMPIDIALGNVAKRIRQLDEAAQAAGRGHIPTTLVVFGDPTLETLVSYRDIGIERVVLGASRQNWDEPSTTMAFIDRYTAVIPELA